MADKYFDYLFYLLGAGGSIVVVLTGALVWFLRDYALRYHDTHKVLFERIETLNAKREAAWQLQGEFCRRCFALVNRVVERVGGKAK